MIITNVVKAHKNVFLVQRHNPTTQLFPTMSFNQAVAGRFREEYAVFSAAEMCRLSPTVAPDPHPDVIRIRNCSADCRSCS